MAIETSTKPAKAARKAAAGRATAKAIATSSARKPAKIAKVAKPGLLAGDGARRVPQAAAGIERVHNPNGYVSGMPGLACCGPSGVTAVVWSNHT